MPPRYAYWTILAGGLPTAFRAAERDDLLPTFQRIREKHPDAEMKWFARGQLWASPDEAQQARGQGAERGRYDERRSRPEGGPAASREPRGRDWRPGGEHRDPRQKYKDAKKTKNLDRRNERFARKHRDEGAPPRGDFKRDDQDVRRAGPSGPPKGDWRDRPPREKPHGDKLRPPSFRPRDDRGPRDERRPWENRPPRSDFKREDQDVRRGGPSGPPKGDWRDRPKSGPPRSGDREGWRDRPKSFAPREDRPRGDWRDRPPREKPHGDKIQAQKDHGWRRDAGPATPKPTGGSGRPFERKQFDRKGPPPRGDWRDRNARGGPRGQGTEEPPPPARPRGPNREPRRSEEPPPQVPPRPNDPREPPPSPPERGRSGWNRKPPRRR